MTEDNPIIQYRSSFTGEIFLVRRENDDYRESNNHRDGMYFMIGDTVRIVNDQLARVGTFNEYSEINAPTAQCNEFDGIIEAIGYKSNSMIVEMHNNDIMKQATKESRFYLKIRISDENENIQTITIPHRDVVNLTVFGNRRGKKLCGRTSTHPILVPFLHHNIAIAEIEIEDFPNEYRSAYSAGSEQNRAKFEDLCASYHDELNLYDNRFYLLFKELQRDLRWETLYRCIMKLEQLTGFYENEFYLLLQELQRDLRWEILYRRINRLEPLEGFGLFGHQHPNYVAPPPGSARSVIGNATL